MTFKIVVSLRARKDIEESYDWYEGEKLGLGVRFVLSIDHVFNVISMNPEAFARQKKDYRQLPVKDFPYLIVYKIQGKDTINILRVFHTSRNPKFKYKRT